VSVGVIILICFLVIVILLGVSTYLDDKKGPNMVAMLSELSAQNRKDQQKIVDRVKDLIEGYHACLVCFRPTKNYLEYCDDRPRFSYHYLHICKDCVSYSAKTIGTDELKKKLKKIDDGRKI